MQNQNKTNNNPIMRQECDQQYYDQNKTNEAVSMDQQNTPIVNQHPLQHPYQGNIGSQNMGVL